MLRAHAASATCGVRSPSLSRRRAAARRRADHGPPAMLHAARRWWSRAAASTAIASATGGRAWDRTSPTLASRRTPDRLQQALVAPDEEVLAENRFVRFVTRDGATITGKLLNQDAISVQLINPKEELKTYLRATLREYTIVDKGLMPSVQGKLTTQQVADIVAWSWVR